MVYWIEKRFEERQGRCVKCRKQQAGVSQQLMTDLPRERLQERVSPFTNSSIDYFGPFEVTFMRKTIER